MTGRFEHVVIHREYLNLSYVRSLVLDFTLVYLAVSLQTESLYIVIQSLCALGQHRDIVAWWIVIPLA
jgi:hypothetical protein